MNVNRQAFAAETEAHRHCARQHTEPGTAHHVERQVRPGVQPRQATPDANAEATDRHARKSGASTVASANATAAWPET